MIRQVGEKAHDCIFSDQELDEQMKAIHLVIEYLDGRGDAKIVVDALRRDKEVFEGFKRVRQEHKKPRGMEGVRVYFGVKEA